MTERIELFFWIGLKGLNFFIEYDSKGWTFFLSMTQRITFGKGSKIFFNDPQNWTNEKKELKELNLFLKYDSKNWTFFQYDSKNWTFFNMTQRIKPLVEYDSKNRTLFWIRLKEWNDFFEYDSMNRTHFFNMTQWIEPCLTWLEELNFFFWKKRLKELKFLEHESKNWIFEFFFFFEKKKKPQRIQLFSKIRYKELNFLPIWLNFFSKYDSKNLTLHFTMTQRLFFSKKTKTSKSSTFFMTHRLKPFCFNIFSKKKKWLKELIPFLNYDSQNVFFLKYEYDSQNWFFFNTNHRIDLFFWICFFFLTLNLFFFEFDSKNWNSLIRLRGITFFTLICLKELHLSFIWTIFTWLKELNFFKTSQRFFLISQRIEPLRKKAQRIEPFFFWIWLKELNLFQYDSKNWISFWVWLKKKIELFFLIRLNETTQWIEPIFLNVTQIEIFGWKILKKNSKLIFSHDPKNRTRFFQYFQRIEPFSIGLKDLMLFSLTQRIELFLTRTDRIGPFSWIWRRELKIFLGFFHVYFFSQMMQRIEPFFLWIWRKELNPFFFECDVKNLIFFLNMTQRIEPFLLFDAKKRTFISLIWMTPRIVFFKEKIPNELNFLKYDSKNWTFEPCVKKKRFREWNSFKIFFEMTHRIEPLFLNLFKMTQRVEVFFQYDSKNWTLCFSQNVSKNWTFF